MLSYIAKTAGQVTTNIACGVRGNALSDQLHEVLGMCRLYAATEWQGTWLELCATVCDVYRQQWAERYCCAMNSKDALALTQLEGWLSRH